MCAQTGEGRLRRVNERGGPADTSAMKSTSPATAGHQPAEPLIIAAHLAKRLAISQAWVYQAVKDGRLPHRRLGSLDGQVRFFPSEIDTWLDEQRLAWAPARRR